MVVIFKRGKTVSKNKNYSHSGTEPNLHMPVLASLLAAHLKLKSQDQICVDQTKVFSFTQKLTSDSE